MNFSLCVGYLEQGLMVTEPEKLRRHYWESLDSKLDVMSLFSCQNFGY